MTNYSDIDSAKNFKFVFGAEEIFPVTKTKMLKNLPEDLLRTTYETVSYNGNTYLVPQLELLFLDRFIGKEGTPRIEGYDAELLAKQYNLKKNLVIHYFEEYYVKPKMVEFKENRINDCEIQLIKLEIFVNEMREECQNPNDINELEFLVEEEFSAWRNNPNMLYNGVKIGILPQNIFLEFDLNGNVVLKESTKNSIKQLMEIDAQKKIKEFETIREELEKIFNEEIEMPKYKNNDLEITVPLFIVD